MHNEAKENGQTSNGPEAVRSAVGFPCTSCGSQMQYDPGRGKLYCSYCESEGEIESRQIEAPEYFYYPGEDRFEAPRWEEMDNRVLTCPSCGADTVMSAAAMTATCPFCGSHYVTGPDSSKEIIQPETLVPFRITREAALGHFATWVRKRWLAPRAFRLSRHTLDPKGVYIPYWTFDASLATQYSGYGGRRRTVRYTVTVNGKRQTRTRTVTDWYPISGTGYLDFDDLPVPATRKVDRRMLEKVGPYSLKILNVYNPAYLSGFFAERYSVGLSEGFGEVERLMYSRMEAHIRESRGYDTYRGMQYDHRPDRVRFKHILVPLWLSTYTYRNRLYQLLVNGESGRVAGKSPISALKVAGLVALGILGVGLLIYLLMLGGS